MFGTFKKEEPKSSYAATWGHVPMNRKLEYVDSEFTRYKDGEHLERVEAEIGQRLYPQERWATWGEAVLAIDRCRHVFPDGRALLGSTIKAELGDQATPHQLLSTYFRIPNGQVKNFLNACRTVSHLKGNFARICVVGSKAAEGGGIWHKYFALFVTTKISESRIDFFDYSERPNSWLWQDGVKSVQCTWYQRGISEEEVNQNYDVVIDDAWIFEGPLNRKYTCPYYSLKGVRDSEGYEPFLHYRETRRFSHQPTAYEGPCKCMVCKVVSACVNDYEGFFLLRSLCVRLGHKGYCQGQLYVDDNARAGQLMKDILKNPTKVVYATSARFLLAIQEEVPFEKQGVLVVQTEGERTFTPYSRFGAQYMPEKVSYSRLEGKCVSFSGVSSTILEGTKIRSPVGSAVVTGDVVFVGSVEAWTQVKADIVYADVTSDVARKWFPDWKKTPYVWRGYVEYNREKVEIEKKEPLKPLIETRGVKDHPTTLYPYVKSTILFSKKGQGAVPLGAVLCSGRFSKEWLELDKYQVSLWRTSFYLSDGYWYPYLKKPENKMGVIGNFPPDVTIEELKVFGYQEHLTYHEMVWKKVKIKEGELKLSGYGIKKGRIVFKKCPIPAICSHFKQEDILKTWFEQEDRDLVSFFMYRDKWLKQN